MTNPTERRARELTSAGYRRVSRNHMIVSRIDRPDWYTMVPQGTVNVVSADHYRRCSSFDKLQIKDADVFFQIPHSYEDIADPFDQHIPHYPEDEPDPPYVGQRVNYSGNHGTVESVNERHFGVLFDQGSFPQVYGMDLWHDDPKKYHDYIVPLEEETNDMMNLTNVAALLRQDTTTITVIHVGDKREKDDSIYTYKALKTMAATLQRGDYVAVKNNRGIRLAEVQEVHDEPQIDLESSGSQAINYRWAFQKIDVDLGSNLEWEDKAIVDRLKDRQVQNTRQQAMAMLGITDASEVLKGITTENETGKETRSHSDGPDMRDNQGGTHL